MARDPAADRATLSSILAEAQAGRHIEAITRARSALQQGLEHPLLLNLAALGLEREGRGAEAEPLLRRAVRIAPRDVSCRNALGLCLLGLARPQEALEQFDAVLGLEPGLAHAHVNRGNALHALGVPAAAGQSYRRALDIDPNQAMALAGLASIACWRGAYDDARSAAEKALALSPALPEALMSLAEVDLADGALGRAEERVRGLLATNSLSQSQHAHAQGLLGDILDGVGRYEEAFAAYTACNETLRQRNAGRFPNAREYVEALAAWWDRAAQSHPPRPRGAVTRAGGATKHIFVLGFLRSGTTLLGAVLEGHPGVAAVKEEECLVDAVHEFLRRPEDLERLASASPEILQRFRAAYWRRVAAAGVEVNGKVFVDTCALNSLKLPLIAQLFPDAKILFSCRDPRDLVLSCFTHRFRLSAPAYQLLTLEGAARYYVAVTDLLIRLTQLLALDVCLVRHEDAVTAFAREMVRVCEFLGLEWHPAMGDFALRAGTREEPLSAVAQLVRGLGTEGVGRWRLYRPQLEPVAGLLEPWVRRFYYDP
ncbi:MAG TPA: sulfotransferase [Steroidobacteraceae bacterium]|nr:sulfotransferase [Steroidobacteraceae bacterium]